MHKNSIKLVLATCFAFLAGVLWQANPFLTLEQACAQAANPSEQITKARDLKKSSQIKEATEALKDAIKSDDKNPEAHYVLGWIYAEHGKRKAAVTEFQKTLELNPPEADAKEAKDAIDRIKKKGFGVKHKRKIKKRRHVVHKAVAAPSAGEAGLPGQAAAAPTPKKTRIAKAPGLPGVPGVGGVGATAPRAPKAPGITPPSGIAKPPGAVATPPGLPGGPGPSKAGPPPGAGPSAPPGLPGAGGPGAPPGAGPPGAPGAGPPGAGPPGAPGAGPPGMPSAGPPGTSAPGGAKTGEAQLGVHGPGSADEKPAGGGIPIPLIVGGVGVILVGLGVWKKMQTGKSA